MSNDSTSNRENVVYVDDWGRTQKTRRPPARTAGEALRHLRAASEAADAAAAPNLDPEAEHRQTISNCADVVNFILAKIGMPTGQREYVDALLGVADGRIEFESPDVEMGKRLGDKADVHNDSVKKRAQRARKDFEAWQAGSGWRLVEADHGGQKGDERYNSRYRLPVLEVAGKVMAKIQELPPAIRGRYIEREVDKVINELRGEAKNTDRGNKRRRDDEAEINRLLRTAQTSLRKCAGIVNKNGGDPVEFLEGHIRWTQTLQDEYQTPEGRCTGMSTGQSLSACPEYTNKERLCTESYPLTAVPEVMAIADAADDATCGTPPADDAPSLRRSINAPAATGRLEETDGIAASRSAVGSLPSRTGAGVDEDADISLFELVAADEDDEEDRQAVLAHAILESARQAADEGVETFSILVVEDLPDGSIVLERTDGVDLGYIEYAAAEIAARCHGHAPPLRVEVVEAEAFESRTTAVAATVG